jgi:ELWxxDGT repeat protein
LTGHTNQGDFDLRLSKTISIALLAALPLCPAYAEFTAQLIADIAPGAAWSFPRGFASHKGQVYFGAFADDVGLSLWATDGTTAGTRLVSNLNSGTMMQEFDHRHPLIVSDGHLMYFPGYDSVHGSEPWVSDGTTAGTRMLFEMYPGDPDPYAYIAPSSSGAVYAFLPELWRSDGTIAGTVRFSSPATGGPDNVSYPIQVDGRNGSAGSPPHPDTNSGRRTALLKGPILQPNFNKAQSAD